MLAWIAIIYLLLLGLDSFLNWSARSQFGALAFFSAVGFVLGGILVAVGLVFLQATIDMLAHGEMRYHDFNGTLWFVLTAIAAMTWALFQVRAANDEVRHSTDRRLVDHEQRRSKLSGGEERCGPDQ